ncbi:hypothetical protein SKAU_G00288490 [Synaphobranchus kaupii]|uniref:Uncharacterized protein n=1 Tax=Synaphobranchus kaupii TaxID=118154 RepID=A0A9Q1ET81_SYNKA|nr:hypothetical protein SKAU_G00288490 [Synaphobranchus kaupii]
MFHQGGPAGEGREDISKLGYQLFQIMNLEIDVVHLLRFLSSGPVEVVVHGFNPLQDGVRPLAPGWSSRRPDLVVPRAEASGCLRNLSDQEEHIWAQLIPVTAVSCHHLLQHPFESLVELLDQPIVPIPGDGLGVGGTEGNCFWAVVLELDGVAAATGLYLVREIPFSLRHFQNPDQAKVFLSGAVEAGDEQLH